MYSYKSEPHCYLAINIFIKSKVLCRKTNVKRPYQPIHIVSYLSSYSITKTLTTVHTVYLSSLSLSLPILLSVSQKYVQLQAMSKITIQHMTTEFQNKTFTSMQTFGWDLVIGKCYLFCPSLIRYD